jgi:hypothetical protein
MKISYAITCFNEIEETKRLTQFLFENIRPQDEVVILMDSKGPDEMWDYLLSIESKLGVLMRSQFNNDFAEWKNRLSAGAWGDVIFNIDPDEIPNIHLIDNLPSILENNNIDLVWVPRINTVQGIGLSHVQKWGWNISKLDNFIEEKEFDLNNPEDLDEYNLLKRYNLIIEENNVG